MDSVFYGALAYLNSSIRDARTLNHGKICEIPDKRQDSTVRQIDGVGKYYFWLLSRRYLSGSLSTGYVSWWRDISGHILLNPLDKVGFRSFSATVNLYRSVRA